MMIFGGKMEGKNYALKIDFLLLLQVILIAFKVAGVIDARWGFVFIPIYVKVVLFLLAVLLLIVADALNKK